MKSYSNKFWEDEHNKAGVSQGNFINISLTPLVLFSKRLDGMFKALEDKHIILANQNGGYCFRDKNMVILEERTSNKLVFPELPVNGKEPEEQITISKWYNGIHWYLKSNKRTFNKKHNSLESAKKKALEFVTESQIKIDHGRYQYKHDGD